MKTEEKAQLIERLKLAIRDSGLSQNKFAEERLGISTAMISRVLKEWNDEKVVGEGTWNTIIKYLSSQEDYKYVPTANFVKVCNACEAAYANKAFVPVIGDGGYGKTVPLHWFKRHQEANRGYKVHYVNCEDITSPKRLFAEILSVLGGTTDGTQKQQVLKIKQALEKQDCLLILDEISALKDHNVVAIKPLMTALKGICGIVLAGTPYFINNLNKGANKSKHLYSETRDRLFMITYTLQAPSDEEAERIFIANGLTGEALSIVMGQVKAPAMKPFAWNNKPTFRGISDCLSAIKVALSNTAIQYPITFSL